jgi:hypothetical protein
MRTLGSVEGRYRIFSKHLVSESTPPGNDPSDEQLIVEEYGDKEVKETVD